MAEENPPHEHDADPESDPGASRRTQLKADARPKSDGAKKETARGGAGADDADDADDDEKGDEKGKEKGDEKGKEKGDEKGKEKGDAGDEEKKPSPLQKPWVRVALVIVAVLVLIAAGIWFYRYWTHGRFVQETNNAYIQADQVVVSSRVAGAVEEVFVTDNQEVEVGQRLVRIDNRTSGAQVSQAVAVAVQGRANIRQYEAQIREQEAVIAESLAQAEGARVKLRYAASQVERYEPLALSGAERGERLSEMVSNRDQAAATLRQSTASVTQARRKVATLQAQMELGRAQVAQGEAQARQAQVDVESAMIVASVAGRIGDRQVRVGQYAQVGTRLMTVVPVQSLYLVANFKETQIGLMRVGQPATIKVDALNGESLSGTVDSFSPGTGAQFALIPPSNATGNFTKIVQRVPVKIRIAATTEATRVLVPGLSVEVSVDTLGSKDDVQRRKDENKANKESNEQHLQEGVQRDRDLNRRENGEPAASGAGK